MPSEFNGKLNRTEEIIDRRIILHGGQAGKIRHEPMVSPHATGMMLDVSALATRYETQRIPNQRDLMIIFTVRFSKGTTFQAQYETAQSFTRNKLCVERNLAVVLVQHQPGLSGCADGKAHCHALISAREFHDSNFLSFTSLLKASPTALLAAERATWLDQVA